ncbi:MAG: hypothetical protein ABI954_02115 [Pyrinomonadaceae bacterium]
METIRRNQRTAEIFAFLKFVSSNRVYADSSSYTLRYYVHNSVVSLRIVFLNLSPLVVFD